MVENCTGVNLQENHITILLFLLSLIIFFLTPGVVAGRKDNFCLFLKKNWHTKKYFLK